MAAPTFFRRALLRKAAADAAVENITLLQALQALESGTVTTTSTGRFLTGTSANGHSVTYALPPHSDITPTQALEAAVSLVDLYTLVLQTLPASPSDETILATMLESLRAVTHYSEQFQNLRRLA